jgi:hypothetical protein
MVSEIMLFQLCFESDFVEEFFSGIFFSGKKLMIWNINAKKRIHQERTTIIEIP